MDKFLKLPRQKPNAEQMDIEKPDKKQHIPWVEKYRPKKLSELAYQFQVTETLRNVLKTGNLPNLLFYGPAGTGKTSAILALAKELFGNQFYRDRILELNASDERGINVIREKVKNFAVKEVKKNPDKNFHCPRIKIAILDEADLLTNDAQSALRRIMEDNSSTTRFCIICNYVTKIIEPIASRCVKFRFKSIPTDVQFQKLSEICQKEEMKVDKKNLQILMEKGDLRQSINSLQSLSYLSTVPTLILPVHYEECKDILQSIERCKTLREVVQYALKMEKQGFAIDEIISGFYKHLQNYHDQKIQAILFEALSSCQEKIQLGACQLPLIDLFTTIYYTLHLQI